jgi:NADH-quinone oxidoreductase subunit L
MLTAFYMFRMLFLTFYGSFRGTHEQEHHLHESPKSMTVPLIVLAVLSTIGGFIGVPEVLGGGHWLAQFLEPVFHTSSTMMGTMHLDHSTEYLLMGVSVVAAVISAIIAYVRYAKNNHIPVPDNADRGVLANLSYNKYYIDEIYDALIAKPLNLLSGFFYRVVDKTVIDGFVNGLGKATAEASKGLRLLQAGNIGFYIFMMVIGIIALLFYGFYNI